MIRWSLRQEAKSPEPRQMINLKHLELETAKEILKEVFHARPSDVEDMIQRRLEEKHWNEGSSWTQEEELWPQEFYLGD
jgi:hypothetical protein